MSEEQDIGQMATDANAAKSMLDNKVFNQAFVEMNNLIMEQLLATPLEAHEERERLYNMYKAGQMYVQQFKVLINRYEMVKQQQDVLK